VIEIDKTIIGDLSVIRDKGYDYFSDSLEWPVTTEEFHRFVDHVRSEYFGLIINSKHDILTDISLVELSFVSHIVQVLHFNYTKQYCIENKLQLEVGDDSHELLNPDWKIMGKAYMSIEFPHGKLVRVIRRIAKGIVFNRHLSVLGIIRGILFGSKVVGIGSYDRIKKEYIEKNNIFCEHWDWPDFFEKAKKEYVSNIDTDLIDEFRELAIDNVIDPFLLSVQKHNNNFVKGIDFVQLRSAWIDRFTNAYKLYSGLQLLDKPDKLLVTEVAKPHSKIITLSYQRSGCDVLNFNHGNDAGLLKQKYLHQALTGHSDKYVLETDVMCHRFESSVQDREIESKIKTKYYSVSSDYYSVLRKSKYHGSRLLDKVMLMGYPMNLWRDPDEAYLFFSYRLTLEYCLINMIQSENYRVIYKAHPDRLKEISGVIDDVVYEMKTEPFEDVWMDADVLVFTYVSTTTFCYAVNLPIPIVLIELEGLPWSDGVRDIVEKRVSIVKANINQHEVTLNRDELINAIVSSKNKVNLDVSKKITG